jgi:hypothetical protein
MTRRRAPRATLIAIAVLGVFAIAAANAVAAGTPTITLEREGVEKTQLSGQLEDPTNPTLIVRTGQEGAGPSELTLEAVASSDEAVAPLTGVTLVDEGPYWVLAVAPAAVGLSEITLKVIGLESKTATKTFTYGASPAFGVPALTRSYQDAADLSIGFQKESVEIPTMLAASSRENVLRMFRPESSGEAIYTRTIPTEFAFTTPGEPALNAGELIGISSGFEAGGFTYLAGPIGTGSGPGAESSAALMQVRWNGLPGNPRMEFERFTRSLKPGLIAWDEALGNEFGFAAAGFSVGGMAAAGAEKEQPFIGFESPTPGGEALVVQETTPVSSLVSGSAPHFGEPIDLDLDGLGIREMRKTEARGEPFQILILAGEPGGGESSPARLFLWDGVAGDPARPVRTEEGGSATAALPAAGGTWEGLITAPGAATGSAARLLVAQGSTDLYGTGVPSREMPAGPLRKSASHLLALRPAGPPGRVEDLSAVDSYGPGGPGAAELSWTPPDDGGSPITGYEITSPQLGSPILIAGGLSSYVVEGLARGSTYGFQIAAITAEGEATPSNEASVTLLEITRASPTSVDFGSQRQGTLGAPHVVTFTVGTEALRFAHVTVAGADRDDFVVVREECSWKEVGLGQSCEAALRFAPSAVGPRSATLDLYGERSFEGPEVEVPLSGEGTPPAEAVAPSNFFAPTVSGKKRVGGELICAPGGWTASPAATFTYAWQREGKAIAGATASTYEPVKADKNMAVRCEVTGTNSAGSATAFSAAVTIKKAKNSKKAGKAAARAARAREVALGARIESRRRSRR